MTKKDAIKKKTGGELFPQLFPMFLKLGGRTCLVVGAGRVAESKVESLLRSGARVRVIAPEASPGIRKAAAAGTIAWERRVFRPGDLRGAFLVVAATSSPKLHRQIFRLARQSGVLCNAVDEPARCDFYYPAVVRRGPLQIAISTSGNSPALAARLRRELEAELERRFPAAYGPWVERIGKARAKLLARNARRAATRAAILELSSGGPPLAGRFARDARRASLALPSRASEPHGGDSTNGGRDRHEKVALARARSKS